MQIGGITIFKSNKQISEALKAMKWAVLARFKVLQVLRAGHDAVTGLRVESEKTGFLRLFRCYSTGKHNLRFKICDSLVACGNSELHKLEFPDSLHQNTVSQTAYRSGVWNNANM